MPAPSRSAALALVAAAAPAAAAAGVAASLRGSGGSGASAVENRAASTEPARTPAAPLPLSRAVGRKIVTGMAAPFPSRWRRARARRGQVGGVILFGPNVSPGLGRAIAALQRAARAG